VLVRSINGKRMIADALSGGSLEKMDCNKDKVLSLVKKMSEKKMNRGRATLKRLNNGSCP